MLHEANNLVFWKMCLNEIFTYIKGHFLDNIESLATYI